MLRLKRDTGFLVLMLLVAAAVRLDFLIASKWVIDSDEGIVGLMAKHISEGGDFPIFYYGQHYMGSFEAFVAAMLFKLFGLSSVTLKLTPFLFSLAMVPLMYQLGNIVGGTFAARTAALLWALPPSPLVVWSSMARGGFIEVVWLGALASLITIRWLQKERPKDYELTVIGIILGFGWWVNNQIIFFMLPIAFMVCCRLVEERGQFLTAVLRGALHGLAGFMVGSLPFWAYNFAHAFASFGILHRAPATEIPEHIAGLFSTALPMLLGAKRFWHAEDIFPGATGAVLALYILLGCVSLASRHQHLRALLRARVDRKAPIEIFYLILITALVAFSLSSFGHLVTAPRYLLPIYIPLFVLVAHLVAGTKRMVPGISKIIPVLLVSIALCSCYLGGRAIPGQPFVANEQRVSVDHSELISWLQARDISFVRTNYWIGYRLAFETAERVKFIRFKEPLDTRISEYTTEGEKLPMARVPYVLVPAQANPAKDALRALGFTFSETMVSGYVVISDIVSKGEGAVPVQRALLRASASRAPQDSVRAIDQDPGTRWGSGGPQDPSMWFEVVMGRARLLRGFSLDMRGWETDYPRELKVVGTKADGTEVTLLSEDQYRAIRWLLPTAGQQVRVDFDPLALTKIRLLQLGTDAVFDWSIAEVTLWE